MTLESLLDSQKEGYEVKELMDDRLSTELSGDSGGFGGYLLFAKRSFEEGVPKRGAWERDRRRKRFRHRPGASSVAADMLYNQASIVMSFNNCSRSVF